MLKSLQLASYLFFCFMCFFFFSFAFFLFTYPIEGCHWYSKPGWEAAPKHDDAIPWDQIHPVPPFRQKESLLAAATSATTQNLHSKLQLQQQQQQRYSPTSFLFLQQNWYKQIGISWRSSSKSQQQQQQDQQQNHHTPVERSESCASKERETKGRERERERGGLWVGPEITNCGNNNDRES